MAGRTFGFLVAATMLAGCAGSSASDDVPPAEPFQPPEVDETTGGLQGVVTDDSLAPISGAMVGLLDRKVQTTTDELGRFAFSALDPGRAQFVAQALGFHSYSRSVEIIAGVVTEANVELFPIPVEVPYEVTQIKNGKIFCGLAWRVPPPANGLSGVFAACGAVYNTPLSSLDSFVVPFELTSGNISAVKTLVFETSWTPTQVFGSGLRVGWEVYQNITPTYGFTEPLRTFATARGGTPLYTSASAEVIEDNVTHFKPPPEFCGPNGPCRFWGRTFPHASTLGASSPADFATYVDQTYTHYVTEFYGEPAPPDFRAVPDA